MSDSRIELLSPAGDLECLTYALRFGADAVYIGAKEFGMRAAAENFGPEELAAASNETHAAGKRLYLTLNTLPTNAEIDRMPAFVRQVAPLVDAFIVADLGVLEIVKREAPGAEVHLSTQAGIANWAAARAAYNLGAQRVVLARELTLADIAEIRARTPAGLALEVFVHGAMCMSFSGRCLLSQHMVGRDANRGQCAQSCRWKYALVEEKRPGEYMEIGETGEGSYILSADDLCALPFLDRILAAGATSLKIEGRAKSFYYVASTTAAYRAALNAALHTAPGGYEPPAFALGEVERISHRPYSPGFYLGTQGATVSPENSGYLRGWQLIGVVQDSEGGRARCVQRGKFSLGESLEALLPEGRTLAFNPCYIWNENQEEISATPHTKMTFYIDIPEVLPPFTILRKKL